VGEYAVCCPKPSNYLSLNVNKIVNNYFQQEMFALSLWTRASVPKVTSREISQDISSTPVPINASCSPTAAATATTTISTLKKCVI
jgi:hypothetical protein